MGYSSQILLGAFSECFSVLISAIHLIIVYPQTTAPSFLSLSGALRFDVSSTLPAQLKIQAVLIKNIQGAA